MRRRFTSLLTASLFVALSALFHGAECAPPTAPASDARPSAAPDEPAVEQVRKQIQDGHYAEAETAASEFLDSRKAAGETDTPAVARMTRLLVQALTRETKGRDPATRELALRSVDLSRQVFGESTAEHAESLLDLGELALRNEAFDEGRSAFARAMAIQEQVFGPKSPQIALTLSRAAAIEGMTGNFATCRAFMERAIAIQEEVLGPDALQVAAVRHNLAILLAQEGDLLGAAEQAERVVAIRMKGLAPDHQLTALSTQNLAFYRYRQGDYVEARELFEKALRMQERSLGPVHSEIGLTLANLAATLAAMGRLQEARADYERALAIFQASVAENNSLVSRCRSELASLLARMGEGARAKELMASALPALEEKFGPIHQEVAGALNDLAAIEYGLGETDAARAHYERALSILERVYGEGNPFLSRSLIGLGELRLEAGDFEEAEPVLRRVLAIDDAALGPQHPEGARVRVDLARTALGGGDRVRALQESLQAEAILRGHFDHLLLGLAEREALDYEGVRVSGLGVALSVLASDGKRGPKPASVAQVWSGVAGSRALVLDRIASRHRALVTSETHEAKELARALAMASNRLASLVVKGPDPDHPGDYRRALSDAAAERERVERDIAEHSGASAQSSLPADAITAVKSALPPESALVAFVRYAQTEPAARATNASATPRPKKPVPSYAAFVLRSDGSAPRFLALGSANALDALVSGWMDEAAHPATTMPGPAAELRYREAAAAVRARLWDPVGQELAGARTVFIVPDGTINLVNFAALPAGDGTYVIEHGQVFHYLSAERDLIRHRERPPAKGGSLVMGAPDFDAAPDAIAQPAIPVSGGSGGNAVPTPASTPTYRSPSSACAGFATLRFDPLPATAEEASEVESVLRRAASPSNAGSRSEPGDAGTTRLTGPLATEKAFKTIAPRRGRLHLATHGFYLDPACGAPRGAGNPVGGSDSTTTLLEENPLLLSGIALAGANHRADAPRDGEDGILTAEEIASLDLSGVEWVVLSGCETALGSVRSGEGIFGLRRAFEVAGAATLVMSLWKVDDRATLEWMKNLYERREAGVPAAQAVHDAGLAVLRARRDKGWSTHPFYWGAFVSAGDWR